MGIEEGLAHSPHTPSHFLLFLTKFPCRFKFERVSDQDTPEKKTKFKKLRFVAEDSSGELKYLEKEFMICFADKVAKFCDSSPTLRVRYFLQLESPFSPQLSMRRSTRKHSCSVIVDCGDNIGFP